ncbi:SDR family oxidoreductase [Nocardia sp. 348MFTsu5.1]|uniref:SDR family oxidoreductase n=1 Tax=Nocardia sp. 348MFTsu5.1 TaxID=1172185 RepID=UPI0003818DBC|nr:SDR family oxidoreductase [Nocardia sp. 348MFTsu5.1]
MATLRNKVVFITGAGSGIGAATARALAARGAKVILVDVDENSLRQLADELGPKAAISAVADVTDLAAMQAAVDTGVNAFGGIDAVLANAGIASYGSVLHVDPVTFRRVIDINVTGVFHTVRAALPHLIARQGYVLVVSSMAAYVAGPGMAAYAASKAGVENFANALRLEVAHQGVAVGSAHMSWIDTPLVRDSQRDLSTFTEMLDSLPGPLSKLVPVEDCAGAFVRGIERRKRRVYVPRWVGLMRWFKPAFSSAAVGRQLAETVPTTLPLMDQETAALGRFTSARNLATGVVPPGGPDALS